MSPGPRRNSLKKKTRGKKSRGTVPLKSHKKKSRVLLPVSGAGKLLEDGFLSLNGEFAAQDSSESQN
jgi:hypothetical protein